jgi:SAM-dependent methyltransferase
MVSNRQFRIAEAYDQLAYDYEHSVDVNNAYNTDYERPAMMGLLPRDLSGRRVLDAGCAAGWYAAQLLSLQAEVTAIDISEEMVAATKRRVDGRAQVLRQDLSEALPFADCSFDIVLSSLTLHYIADWNATFLEFARVLRASGRLMFSINHPFMDFTKCDAADYFSTQIRKENWGVASRPDPVEIHFYRRPLQDVVNMTTRHFMLDRVVEPQPLPTFEQKRPDAYQRLMTQPYFLIVAAHKG